MSLRGNLYIAVADYQVEGICIEEPFGAHKAALRVLYSMMGVAIYCAEVWGITWSLAHLATLKKFATGKGNADKPAMRVAAEQRWGTLGDDVDDNQVDAMWAAEWYRVNVMPDTNVLHTSHIHSHPDAAT
jgi:Holliday junction resolvasome RuvABC endonuclease subunit